MKKVTIKDIAKAANVSVATASMALSKKHYSINIKTREKINKIAKDMGYKPSWIARSLVTKKTNNIGMVVPDINNPYYSELVKNITYEANRNNYRVILLEVNEKTNKALDIDDLLSSNIVDGLLIVSTPFISNKLKAHLNDNKKIVFVDSVPNMNCENIIMGDDTYGGEIVAGHLYEKGYLNVGVLGGPVDDYNSCARINSFINYYNSKRINIKPSNIINCDYSYDDGYEATETLVSNGVRAIFCINDLIAVGCIRKLIELDIMIPSKMAVIGYDNIHLLKYFPIQITTINQFINIIAEKAVNLLLQNIQGKPIEENKILVKPTLIEGETT